jgi:hypothetical protein
MISDNAFAGMSPFQRCQETIMGKNIDITGNEARR